MYLLEVVFMSQLQLSKRNESLAGINLKKVWMKCGTLVLFVGYPIVDLPSKSKGHLKLFFL